MARTRLGWSKEALAYHSGVSWSAIAQIESRRRQNPRPSTLLSLARALDVTVDYLLGAGSPPTLLAHRALVYDSDETLLSACVPFLKEGVLRSESVLTVAPARTMELLRDALGRHARGVDFAEAADWYASPQQAVARYRDFVEEQLAAGTQWMRLVGEPVLAPQRWKADTWARYEALFNIGFAGFPLNAICLYDERARTGPSADVALQTHPYMVGGEGVAPNDAYLDPGKVILETAGS